MQQELTSNNISYSLLKAIDDNGPEALVNKINITNSGIDFGKRLDDFISLPLEEFNKKYLIIQNKITGDLFTLATIVAKSSIELKLNDEVQYEITNSDLEMICKIIENGQLFKQVKKDETRISKFNNREFYEQIVLLRNYADRVFITPEEYSKLIDARASLFNHKSTKKYFNCGDDCEEIYQLEINFKYKNKNVKTILDKIIINHNDETIEPLDLKSGSVDSYEFMKSFFNYKYYLQGGLYVKAIEEWIKTSELAHYKILPFKFIFLPTYNLNNPKTFIFTNKWYEASWKGFTTNSGYKYRGIDELIDILIWHIENQVFNETKEFYENEEIELDDSFIKIN